MSMGHIFYIMGKSSCGTDTIYRRLLAGEEVSFRKLVPYTTRPIRRGETDGEDYIFTDEGELERLSLQGKVIERRSYRTVHGIWNYFTVDDGRVDLANCRYLTVGTLQSYAAMRRYYGDEAMVPIYIEVEDGERLQRALDRERAQKQPRYAELCRRFLADESDFSEEKIREAGIRRRFENGGLQGCLEEIRTYIRGFYQGGPAEPR